MPGWRAIFSPIPQMGERRLREVESPAQCHSYKLRAEPRPCPRISVYLPARVLTKVWPSLHLPSGPAQQRSQETEHRRAAPPPAPPQSSGHCRASRHPLRPGRWLHPRVSLPVRPGECRATGRPRPSNDQLAPHHPHSWESGTPGQGQPPAETPRHSTHPPGSPSPPPGGHPMTGDRKRRGARRRGPEGLRQPALENPE